VGRVALQFSWRVDMDYVADVKAASVSVDTPRPVTAGPLVIRRDHSTNIRPSSAMATGNTARLAALASIS